MDKLPDSELECCRFHMVIWCEWLGWEDLSVTYLESMDTSDSPVSPLLDLCPSLALLVTSTWREPWQGHSVHHASQAVTTVLGSG